MKILWITSVTFGKTIHQWGQLGTASSLKKKGFHVDFMSPASILSGDSILNDFGFGHIPLRKSSIPGAFFLNLNREVANVLKKKLDLNDYDAIISEWQTSLGVMSAFKRYKKMRKRFPPWIFEDRSPPATNSILGHLQWAQYRLSWKHAANYADSVEVLVPGLEKFVRNKYGFKKRIIHCPSGVDLSRFFPLETKVKNERLRIVHHGSLNKGRGLHRIIELGLELESRKIDAEITVFGSGPLKDYFSNAAQKYRWLNFLGELPFDKVPREIRRHDVGILPLPKRLPWDVGSPLKAMEYAASGLCVLATDVDGSIPLMKFDWFFTAPNADPIVAWTESIYEISNNLDCLIGQARIDAENELSWDHAISELHKEFIKIKSLEN